MNPTSNPELLPVAGGINKQHTDIVSKLVNRIRDLLGQDYSVRSHSIEESYYGGGVAENVKVEIDGIMISILIQTPKEKL